MRRRNLFDVMFEQLNRELAREANRRSANVADTTPYDPREFDGYRRENIDGEVTEYVLQDGEWQEVGEEDDDDTKLEVMHSADEDEGSQTTVVADLSTEVRDGQALAEATFNNGVLEVEFSSTVDERSESEE